MALKDIKSNSAVKNSLDICSANDKMPYSGQLNTIRFTDWILRIFTFNDKNPLYLPIILTLHFFDGQSDQGVIYLGIKPVDISQTFRIVGLS